MGKFIKKSDDPNSIWNNLGKLIILTMAGSLIYTLPYFRFYYYDTFVEAFNLTNTQMGMIGSVYGFFGVLSYFIGGLLADRFSVRSLLTFSFISTGLTGLILLTYPSYQVVLAIQAFWGFSTLMTFWPALVKAISMLGNENEKGKSYGFMEGGRGIVNMIQLSIAVAIFGYMAKSMGDKFGLSSVIIFYSVINVLMGLAIALALKGKTNETPVETKEKKKIDFNALKKIATMKYTWMIVAMIFCSYSMNIAYTYFTPYATSQFGSSVVFAAAIAVMAQYVRPASAMGSGLLADKISSSKVFSFGFILMGLGLLGALLIPGQASMIPIFIATVAACYISMYAMQALHFTLFEEAGYSKEMTGMAIGIVCTFGYLPEMVIPIIAGKFLDKYPGAVGYKYFFILLLAFAVIGLITSVIWMGLTKERRQELININKNKKVA